VDAKWQPEKTSVKTIGTVEMFFRIASSPELNRYAGRQISCEIIGSYSRSN
jgi:hypothetical protein